MAEKDNPIKMTLSEATGIINSPEALQLRRRSFPKPSVAYEIAKTFYALEALLKPFNDTRDNIIAKHAIKGPDGKPALTPADGGRSIYTFENGEAESACSADLADLAITEVEVMPLVLNWKELPDGISPAEVALLFILTGGPAV